MTDTAQKRTWEQRLHEAAVTFDDELRRVITYMNDHVVPEVRQNGSAALRSAAAELERLARKMDERSGPPTSPTPPSGTTPRS